VVAVASGSQPRQALAAHAPDLVVDDLADAARVLDWARTQ
jgi:phosphoglycolate phosphatase-like HAD superfamily hydrolase